MYMPAPHDHAAWVKNKAEKQAAWKEKQKSQRAAKRKGKPDDASKSNKKSSSSGGGEKLTLSKSFRAALTTKVQLSDAEIQDLVAYAKANTDSGDSPESKE